MTDAHFDKSVKNMFIFDENIKQNAASVILRGRQWRWASSLKSMRVPAQTQTKGRGDEEKETKAKNHL